MITKRVLILIVTLASCSVVTYSQNKTSILDLIEQSIPKRESGWTLRSSHRMEENPVPLDQYLQIVPQPQIKGDICHVYVVDFAKARKAFDEYRDTGNPEADNKAMAAAETTFPEFRTVIGEEALTTKTYPFSDSHLIITASIYYTDESMASFNGVDSMLVGIVVSPKAQKDAISVADNAVSESTLKGRDTVRVKKYLKVNGRIYLVGVECKGKGVNDLQ